MTTRWTNKRTLLALAGAAVVLGGVTLSSIVFGGVVSVAATDPHYRPVQWMLETTMENSIAAHAADIEVPAGLDLGDPALAERAFGHYSVACTPCHGAPGVDPAPWLVLQPPALPLVETADQWSDAELYWIVKHGIKMTGMPALGPTHQDADLWAIAAFVRQLPTMTAERYQEMSARHGGTMGHAHHEPPVDPPPAPSAAPSAAPVTVTTDAAMASEPVAAPRDAPKATARPSAGRRSATARPRPAVASPAPAPTTPAPAPAPVQHDHAQHDHAQHDHAQRDHAAHHGHH